MAENAKNLNDSEIKIPPENIRIINGHLHVTARFLCARFRIPLYFFKRALDEVKRETELMTISDRTGLWVDSSLFYDLSVTNYLSHYFSEEHQQTMLQLLGHFRERPEACPFSAGDPMSCQKEWCECADPGSITFAERVA